VNDGKLAVANCVHLKKYRYEKVNQPHLTIKVLKE
jgi:hypothetical protein